MAKRYTDEFFRDAVRIATTSGLTTARQLIRSIDERGGQLSSDLGGWAFDVKQVGSATSIVLQGIA